MAHRMHLSVFPGSARLGERDRKTSMGARLVVARRSMAMPGIFISYRREDSAGHAGRIYDRLTERFGSERVYRDIDAIEAGEDFVAAIRRTLADADVLLALIGPRWLRA